MKTSVLVIGLGRFGASAARELMALGHEVLAVDRNEAIVNEIAPRGDARRPAGRRGRGRAQGDRRRPSSSTRSWRSRAGSRRACSPRWPSRRWASRTWSPRRARSSTARSCGAWAPTGWCTPSARWASGSRTRSPVTDVVDYLDVAPRFGIVKVRPPQGWHGRPLRDLDLPGRLAADAGGAPAGRRRDREPVAGRGGGGGRRADPDRARRQAGGAGPLGRVLRLRVGRGRLAALGDILGDRVAWRPPSSDDLSRIVLRPVAGSRRTSAAAAAR